MNQELVAYPASLDIDYPEAANRLTTFFRFIVIIPILFILNLLNSVLFFPVLLLLLFRKKYPRWWFEWNLQLTRFQNRVFAYAFLLTHEYPSTDEEQAVHLELRYPDAASELSRGLPLVKWLLAIPHIIVLYFLAIAVFLVSIFAWFYILFTGRYPQGAFGFVVGFMRWGLRVQAYALLLITDKYPPFSLEA
ncbi:MAG: DUF4389 domain-containing protein [Actinobacteria bacterium]|nr:DUF4389 domain-containing protein [Actinomycetota bacterium]MCL5883019.1 DUF4389 domain-containing protein [Actinomycetota bacterium]